MYHNTLQSSLYKVMIDAMTGSKFIDVSYSNDACDSIQCEALDLQIFFPSVDDVFTELMEEDFLLFGVKFGEEDYIDHQFTLMEVISFVNALDRVFVVKDGDGDHPAFNQTLADIARSNNNDWDMVISVLLKLDVLEVSELGGGATPTMFFQRVK